MSTQPKSQRMTVKVADTGNIIGIMRLHSGKTVQYIDERGILSARLRMDGFWGFESTEAPSSLKCKAEEGLLFSAKPKPDVVKAILHNIKKNPTVAEEIDGYTFVDGYAYKIETED